jgi:hypothetical protein
MLVATSPQALADPIAVIVGLVADRDPTVDRALVADVVTDLAGGRAKRRRLAQALLDKPAVLADGRSPAPRAVADLLIALRKAGATNVSAPVCAECGKPLRTFQRRGEDWYCGVCGPVREPCGACGQLRRVRCRDREGRPRCAQCPPGDGRDPVDLIAGIVTAVDPTLPVDLVAVAVAASVPRAGQRQQLAWALHDRPDLLTGAGAEAPVPLGASADRQTLRRRGAGDHPPGLPPLRSGHPPAPADRRALALPQLHRQVPRPALFALRRRPGGRHPRRARPTAVFLLSDQRPSQSGDLHRLWPSPPCQCPHPQRPALRSLPAGEDDDLLDLRSPRTVLHLHGDRPTVVPGMQKTLGSLRGLRRGPASARRHPEPAPLRRLHQRRPRVLAQLPELRGAGSNPLRTMRPLHCLATPS